MTDRAKLIIRYFDYLVNEYEFQVVQQRYDPQMMGNAFVRFESSAIGVEIVVDRDQVLMSLGDRLDPRNRWFEFSNVLRYFAPSIENAYDFVEKTSDGTWDNAVEAQANRLANLLRQYCEPLLKGDLSMKEQIVKIQEDNKKKLLEGFKKEARH